MPSYRVYLSEGRQLDLEAKTHRILQTDKFQLGRVDFIDEKGLVVASFTTPALQGFTEIARLVAQQG